MLLITTAEEEATWLQHTLPRRRCSLGYVGGGREWSSLRRTRQRRLGRGKDQEDTWQHCNDMRFASWSRIPARPRRYGGQGPALSRRRWEALSRKSGHRQKGRPTSHREWGVQDRNKTTTFEGLRTQSRRLVIKVAKAPLRHLHSSWWQEATVTTHSGTGMAPSRTSDWFRSEAVFSCFSRAVSHLTNIWLPFLFLSPFS